MAEQEEKPLEKLSRGEEDFQEERLRDARIKVVRKILPWSSEAVMALRFHKTYQCPTMAVDKYWRCYWNPAMLATWSDQEIRGVIIHEVMHLLRVHHKRALPIHELWNIAADCEINDDIFLESKEQSEKNVAAEFCLPDWACLPEKFKAPNDEAAEDYYEILLKNNVKFVTDADCDGDGDSQTQGKGKSKKGKSGKSPGKAPPKYGGGSGSDGQKREWERGVSGEEGNDAVGEEEGKIIIRKTAKAIRDCKEPGSISAGMKIWAEAELEEKVDWKAVVANKVAHSLAMVRGLLWKSFKYPSRRQGEFIFPGMVQPNPKVLVVFDTSGSMSNLIGDCLAEMKGILRVLPERNVEYVCGDTTTCTKGKANSHRNVELGGGGGTDMGAIIAENAKGKDLIIVLTDGYTPWCDKVKPRVVACIFSEGEFGYTPPPDWIDTLYVDGSDYKKK